MTVLHSRILFVFVLSFSTGSLFSAAHGYNLRPRPVRKPEQPLRRVGKKKGIDAPPQYESVINETPKSQQNELHQATNVAAAVLSHQASTRETMTAEKLRALYFSPNAPCGSKIPTGAMAIDGETKTMNWFNDAIMAWSHARKERFPGWQEYLSLYDEETPELLDETRVISRYRAFRPLPYRKFTNQ